MKHFHYLQRIINVRHAETKMAEELRYKSWRCNFDSRLAKWICELAYSFLLQYGPDSVFDRNEYQELSWG
jgi:hypothetical protein